MVALNDQQSLFSRERVGIVGVINLTPDSFSDGGRFLQDDETPRVDDVVAEAESMIASGADIIDVGGESTRPGAEYVDAETEIRRTVSVIEQLVKRVSIPIAIDTRKSSVAKAALDAGARIVNDISGLTHDPTLAEVAQCADGLILGHLRGEPRSMQSAICFKDVLEEVSNELLASVRRAIGCGVSRGKLCVDPGIGFGKEFEHNLKLLADLEILCKRLDMPVLVGISRKSFLGRITGDSVGDRELASHIACGIAVFQGANLVRVHDVEGTRRAVQIATALRLARGSS